MTLLIAGTIGLAQTDLKRVIAYSTMSQIGYMIMGVCAGAYAAGLFHLMTHAFFKALLFMAAGSVIGAMAGEQSLTAWAASARRCRSPTRCFVIGGLALTGVPPFSGFFSKDEILLVIGRARRLALGALRRGLRRRVPHRDLHVADDLPRLLGRAVRRGARARGGPPAPRRGATNPANGEVEDTDVGFPGPEHPSPSASCPCGPRWALLAVCAVVGGLVQMPRVDTALDEVPRADLRRLDACTSTRATRSPRSGWCSAPCSRSPASRSPTDLGAAARDQRAHPRALRAALHTLFVNKWYFDEIIDSLVVRPAAWFGRFGQQTFERVVINGLLRRRDDEHRHAPARRPCAALQNGFLRAYAALLVLGIVALAFYFLMQSS